MGIFDFANKKPVAQVDTAMMTRLALDTIHDGVIIVNKDGIIKFINPAAVEMTGCGNANNAVNLNLDLIMKFEGKDGSKIAEADNNLFKSVKANAGFETREYVLLAGEDEKKTPVAVSVTPSGGATSDRVVTFRDISKELEEEGAQTEFVSTASHEMRTPIASIEGYIGLALNPQTATIDARARQYLESAAGPGLRVLCQYPSVLGLCRSVRSGYRRRRPGHCLRPGCFRREQFPGGAPAQ